MSSTQIFRRSGSFLVALAILGSAAVADANNKVFVKGACVDENRNPVEGAVVEVRDRWINFDDKWDADKITSALPTDVDVVGPLGNIGERLKQALQLRIAQNKLIATTTTDRNGAFGITVSHSDPHFLPAPRKPDLYVRCLLETVQGWKVVQPSFPFTPHNVVSATRKDSDATPYDVGELKLPAMPVRVFHILRNGMQRLMDRAGRTIVPAILVYPFDSRGFGRADDPRGTGFAGALFVTMAAGWESEAYIGHEFGHNLHIQSFFIGLDKHPKRDELLKTFKDVILNLTTLVRNMRIHALEKKTDRHAAFFDGWAELIQAIAAGHRGEPPTGFLKGCARICARQHLRATRPEYCQNCNFADTFRVPDCRPRENDYEKSNGFTNNVGVRVDLNGEDDRVQVEGIIYCRLWRLYEKWGFQPIWQALTDSKAMEWAKFYDYYKEKQPDADVVALLRASDGLRKVSAGLFRVGKNGDVFESDGNQSYCFKGRRLAWGYQYGFAAKYRNGYFGVREVATLPTQMRFSGKCGGGWWGFTRKPGEMSDPYTSRGANGRYQWNNGWQFPELGRGVLLFRAKGPNDIHVAISSAASNQPTMYEIVVGGWGNTKSVIRRGAQGGAIVEKAVGIRNQGQFNDYWVSIDSKTKTVRMGWGLQVGSDTFIEVSDPNFVSNAFYFSLSSWNAPIEYSDIRTISLP